MCWRAAHYPQLSRNGRFANSKVQLPLPIAEGRCFPIISYNLGRSQFSVSRAFQNKFTLDETICVSTSNSLIQGHVCEWQNERRVWPLYQHMPQNDYALARSTSLLCSPFESTSSTPLFSHSSHPLLTPTEILPAVSCGVIRNANEILFAYCNQWILTDKTEAQWSLLWATLQFILRS